MNNPTNDQKKRIRYSDRKVRKSMAEDETKVRVAAHFQRSTIRWNDIYTDQSFDAIHIQTRLERVLKFVDQIPLGQSSRVLDLACGAGLTTLELLRREHKVQALDISQNMLHRARENCEGAELSEEVDFIRGDADHLPFHDNSYDLVISMGMISYMPQWHHSVKEMGRVTRPGGHLILTYQSKLGLSHLLNPRMLRLRYLKNRILGNLRPNATSLGTFLMPGAFKNVLRELGLEVLASTSHGFGPFRPLGERIFPDKVNLKIHSFIQMLSDRRLIPFLHGLGKTYIVLIRKPNSARTIIEHRVYESGDRSGAKQY